MIQISLVDFHCFQNYFQQTTALIRTQGKYRHRHYKIHTDLDGTLERLYTEHTIMR